jgi:NADPH:quinone reductase-like Zn-dependent oxidoreductase
LLSEGGKVARRHANASAPRSERNDPETLAAAGRLDVKPTRIFRFEEIREAHRVMETNEAGGKMVVVHA